MFAKNLQKRNSSEKLLDVFFEVPKQSDYYFAFQYGIRGNSCEIQHCNIYFH